MSRESRVLISRIIVVLVFLSSLLALTAGDFFITLITVSWGLILWLLYLMAAHLGTNQSEAEDSTTIIHSLTKVTAGLGAILAASAVKTYGLEQTMWGSYTFNMGGLAMGLGLLVLTLLPLVITQLTRPPATGKMGLPSVQLRKTAQAPPAQPDAGATAQAQTGYSPAAYPPYEQPGGLVYGEDEEEYAEDYEAEDDDDYTEEEDYEYEEDDEESEEEAP